MQVRQSVLDEIIAHARGDKPNECCGLIGGTDGVATTAYRTRNEFASPMRFNIHPTDLFQVQMKLIPEAGEELVAMYHSHPVSPAEPSQTDINLSENIPGLIWLICSLQDDEKPVVRAWSIAENAAEELELAVV
jgi:proteasome lid subunit RPN8/RPN11